MRQAHFFAVAVAALAVLTGVSAGGNQIKITVENAAAAQAQLKSGPQVGERLAGPFHPLNCTGKEEGKKHCLYCENGQNPVAMVFARDVSPQLTKLIKKIDAVTVQNAKSKMGSFVVFLNNTESLTKDLKTLATKESIKKTVLAIDNPAGPEGYKVARDANITVVLYVKTTVAANYAFRNANELTDQVIDQIVNDVAKIQPK